MKHLKVLFVVMLCLAPLRIIEAQSPKRSTPRQTTVKPAAADPTPAPTPAPAARADLSTPIAVVNDQTITVLDLDPAVAQELVQLDLKLAQARQQILNVEINTVLLDTEAKKRKLTSEQLYDLEVTKKIANPTDAEINQFVEANRDQFANSDPKSIRADVVNLLRANREQQLTEDFVRRLRAANPVAAGADVNGPNLNPKAVLATVAGRQITAEAVNTRMMAIAYKLRLNTYEIERSALEQTIDSVLVIAEANKRNVGSEEIVRAEVTNKMHHPTDAEVAKFYSENKARITGDLESVRNQIAVYLDQQEQARLEKALSDRLRKGASIRVLLRAPEQPVQAINIEGEPSRGDRNAPVTLVEFTDFECPSCAGMQPVLDTVLQSYGNRVRFVVRNFPLSKHAHARKAAEAADAANAQGKFFEYTALLFKRQSALDEASLKKYATEVGLDRARFDADLAAGTYAAEVKHDMDEGEIYGVEGTPTIFINGVMLLDLSEAGLRAAIDRALAATASGKSTPN
jgi:protein-disulfide isomerase